MTRVAQTVLITGSTRGIGKGMAVEFMKRGLNVVISGRSQESVDGALKDLHPLADQCDVKLVGVPCEVSDYKQVESLWRESVAAIGEIDIWINNAGIANTGAPIAFLPPDQFDSVVHTNITGTLYGCQVALREMNAQGFGAIYTFEGFGSNGMHSPANHVYGATKFAIRYFTKHLIAETKGGPVIVGYMSPGIVLTDLSLKDRPHMPPEAWANVRKIYNILADRVETVTPFLVDGVLSNTRHGGRIQWLTRRKSLWRFLKSRFTTRTLMDDWQREVEAGEQPAS